MEYSTKINELREIKERKKLLRELHESKKRLFYSNPQAFAPLIREKVTDTLLRNSYPSIRRSPIVHEAASNVVNPVTMKSDNGVYLALMREQRSLIERELTALRMAEENNRKELEKSLRQMIETQGANNNGGVDEIRAMLKSFQEAQIDRERDSQPSNPVVRDLKLLKTNYLLDGGHDQQLIADIDSVIEEAEKKKPSKVNNNKAWTNRRKDLVLAREKSYELRDLERQNADLERRLDMSRVRSGIHSERKLRSSDGNLDNDKMEILQKQIETLQNQIKNLKNQNLEPPITPMASTSVPNISAREIGRALETRNIVILLDFISGIGSHVRSIGVIVSLFHGSDKIGKSSIMESIPVRQRNPTDLDSSTLVNIRHSEINCPVSAEVFALVELQLVTETNIEPKIEAWAKLNLFTDQGELRIGKWKEFFLRCPVQLTATAEELFRYPRYHRSTVHYRIALYSSDDVHETGLTTRDYDQPSFEYTKTNPFMVNNDARNIDDDSDGEKSDITMDLDERPELGFQVIRVKNMTIGDGLELAKLRLTVYHTEGRQKGQIVMSNEGPVTCSTNAVRADFKIACYNFGRQLAKFTNVNLSTDCVVFARFYLEGETKLRHDSDVMEREERLVAWTALPVVKKRSVARRNPSYVTDSLKLLRINRGIHDLCLYEPPALPPTMVFFDRNGFIVGQKLVGRTKLKFRLFHTQILYDSETSSDGASSDGILVDEHGKSTFNATSAWIPIDRTDPPLMPYHNNDGFDLYIDAGRLFPDSVTLVKIEGSIVDRHLNIQGPQFSAVTLMSSDIYNPIFKQRIEVREPHMTPSSTLLLKVMTIDREDKNLVVLGYAALKLFIETGSGRQPNFDNLGVLISLNDGGHQMRIYLTEPSIAGGPFMEDTFVKNKAKPIPGASLLVRVYKPPKNVEGRPININDVPKNYQARLGVIVPMPAYEDGYYYSMSCKPTDGELSIMTRHLQRPKVLLQDLIGSKWSDKLMSAISLGESAEVSNIYKCFDTLNKNAFNFNHIAHYVPTDGFKICIDGSLNLPWSGYPLGHICIYPPGALYMKKPLMAYDRPFFLSKLDLLSTQSSPIWTDGWKTYRRRKYDVNLIAIVHLHEMKITVAKNDFVFTLENQAWIPIKIFDGPYCINESTQMPLISGAPSLAQLQELGTKTVKQFLTDNIASKKIVLLQHSSIVVRQCDSRRYLEMSLSADKELLTLDQSYLPQANLSDYRTIFSSKTDVQFNTTIPVGLTFENFQEFLRVKFKSLIYKLYEQGGFELK